MQRTILVLLIGALALALASPVQARGSRSSVEGEATLRAKDLEAKTLEIGDSVFLVTPETLMRDQKGRLLSLAQLPVREVGQEGGDWPVIGASFKAMRVGNDNVLVSLRLTGAPH